MLLPLILLLGAPSSLDGATMVGKPTTLMDMKNVALKGFQLMDLDHDGFVTKAEILQGAEAAIGKYRAPGDPPLSIPPIGLQLLDEGDRNHDGRISVEEHMASVERQFALDDSNHDGVVTGNERLASMMRSVRHVLDLAGISREAPPK